MVRYTYKTSEVKNIGWWRFHRGDVFISFFHEKKENKLEKEKKMKK